MSSPKPLCGALAGFILVRFLVFWIIANRFPNHRTAWTPRPEYSTTISKEIKSHISFEKTGTFGRPFQDCRLAILRQCSARNVCHPCVSPNRKLCWPCGKCTSSCTDSLEIICGRKWRVFGVLWC